MLTPVRSGQFRRDVKRMEKRGKDLGKLRELLGRLIAGDELPASYKDHPLKGDWKGYRDAHIEPDWLLIYRVASDELQLAGTGSHSDLFNE
ncbi:type II toxin-antitoxin system YafQ family toxin [Mesorhizobium sp. M0276]|uniref:type II toxin-antitoxin system YafQ family toxin n=1 Tax=Mesorhizobium sp. M0276 TaxID=2956928 RepID=UPI0033355FC0